MNDAITKAAKAKGAASFFIVRQVDANQGGNQRITAYIYKADARKRVLQSRMRSRPILKPGAQRWLKAVPLRKTSKFRALPPRRPSVPVPA